MIDLFKPFDEVVIDFDAPPKSGGIDFAKLNTPEAREAAKKHREEREAKMAAKAKAVKFQAEYLYKLLDTDTLNEWEEGFVNSVYGRAITGAIPLTDKQENMLEKIFEKY